MAAPPQRPAGSQSLSGLSHRTSSAGQARC
jgi:hypothetical protein